jgi:hypothetical protein
MPSQITRSRPALPELQVDDPRSTTARGNRLAVIAKLLLVSIVLAAIAIPIRAARARSARRGLRKAILWMLAFNLFYLFAVRIIYPRL